MFYVDVIYSKRGMSRRKPRIIGIHSHMSNKNIMNWHKKEFGNLWLKMMIWNKAAIHIENGITRGTDKQSYARYLSKHIKTKLW